MEALGSIKESIAKIPFVLFLIDKNVYVCVLLLAKTLYDSIFLANFPL